MVLDDFKDRTGNWVASVWCRGEGQLQTQAGRAWGNLQIRCLKSGSMQTARKTYAGCHHTFADFQDFAGWCQSQVGYKEHGFQLDKDIVFKGNKIYSKENCFFVPKDLNVLLTMRTFDRGNLPVGVQLKKSSGRYGATLSRYGKLTYLGYYGTPEEAFSVYKEEKEKLIKEMANNYKHLIDPKAHLALMNYVIEATD